MRHSPADKLQLGQILVCMGNNTGQGAQGKVLCNSKPISPLTLSPRGFHIHAH